ncbi:expressed unknown protein [Seminavis robusta]|uniref:AD domain-containing protein n=1 Tax=Seminavis robusta TaxID=568900 RepID=A0A9N8HMC8_9STRA|nr:expressed unknown protein [Seminavis robusta]|eukprot:Sro735_g194880.1 n/a (207) ;mRNA; f:24605-25335
MASTTKARKGGPNSNNSAKGTTLLSVRYPVNSSWEFTLPNDEIAAGTVYCTDETSQLIVLQKSLVHTTLTFEVRMVQVLSIKGEKLISSSAENSANKGDASLSKPLPVIERKLLDDREKRAIRLAEESFRHINQNATPQGQAIFDRLLKACNEVTWEGKSILVLGQIQVDPPYAQENCKVISKGSGAEGSLDRVKKIVAAAASGGF